MNWSFWWQNQWLSELGALRQHELNLGGRVSWRNLEHSATKRTLLVILSGWVISCSIIRLSSLIDLYEHR